MALKLCRDCQGLVSDAATACPKCGRPPDPPAVLTPQRRKKNQKQAAVGCSVVVLGIAGFILFMATRPSAPPELLPSGSVGGMGTTVTGNVACIDKGNTERAIELSGDLRALMSYVRNARNQCVFLSTEQSVVVEDYSWGYKKIRVPGQATSLWVEKGAVR